MVSGSIFFNLGLKRRQKKKQIMIIVKLAKKCCTLLENASQKNKYASSRPFFNKTKCFFYKIAELWIKHFTSLFEKPLAILWETKHFNLFHNFPKHYVTYYVYWAQNVKMMYYWTEWCSIIMNSFKGLSWQQAHHHSSRHRLLMLFSWQGGHIAFQTFDRY